jgi:hypothetical protein
MSSMDDTVLVGCPTYSGLESCLDEYLEAYKALHWPNRQLMLVDNTMDDGAYARSIKPKVEAVGGYLRRIEPSTDWEDTFYRAWGVLHQHAKWNGYQWVFSLEQDVIVPPLTLDTLLNAAAYVKAPLVLHTYPMHNGKPGFYQGLGCTLIKTELLTAALEVRHKTLPYVEAAIFDVGKRNSHVVLHELLDVKHLDGDSRHWSFMGATSDEVSIGIEDTMPFQMSKGVITDEGAA